MKHVSTLLAFTLLTSAQLSWAEPLYSMDQNEYQQQMQVQHDYDTGNSSQALHEQSQYLNNPQYQGNQIR
jgi:hypothetical protein